MMVKYIGDGGSNYKVKGFYVLGMWFGFVFFLDRIRSFKGRCGSFLFGFVFGLSGRKWREFSIRGILVMIKGEGL